jgi:hypothetical protein
MLSRGPFLAGAMLLATAQPPAGRAIEWSIRVEATTPPAGAASSLPQLTASARGALLSWIERTGPVSTLKFAEWSSGRWSEARTVASGDDWFVNWADVPSVLRLSDGTLVAHWLQKNGSSAYAYDLRLSHSSDEGRTWAAPVTPHHDGTATEHGFASLMELPGPTAAIVWLDGRAMKGHGLPPGKGGPTGAMSLRFARFDRNWKQIEETPLDLRVCDCCPTTVATGADGPVIAFRDRSDREVRDIHVSRYVNGKWSESKPVHDDRWVINACPVNGPALSARGRTIAAAWFTASADRGQAFVAFSTDGGQRFAAPVRLDDEGTLGRVDVELLPDGAAAAAWIELSGPRAQFKVRKIEPAGSRSPAITISELAASRTSGYPRLAVTGRDLVFAWTEIKDGHSYVRTAVARGE